MRLPHRRSQKSPLPPLLLLSPSLLASCWFGLVRGRGAPMSVARCSDIGHSRARACERPRQRKRGGREEDYRAVPLRGWRGAAPRAPKPVGRAATTPHTRSPWGTERRALSLFLFLSPSLPLFLPLWVPSRRCATRYFRATRARRTIGTRVVPRERVSGECAEPPRVRVSRRETSARADR